MNFRIAGDGKTQLCCVGQTDIKEIDHISHQGMSEGRQENLMMMPSKEP